MNKKQIAQMMVEMTIDYTDLYFSSVKKQKMDRQLWAALHIGFITGLKQCGYKQQMLHEALEIAQNELEKITDEIENVSEK